MLIGRRSNHGTGWAWLLGAALVAVVWVGGPGCWAGPTVEEVEGLIGEGRYEDAVTQGRLLRAEARREHGVDSLESGRASQLLAEAMIHSGIGRLDEQVAHAEHAFAVKSRLLEDDDTELPAAAYFPGLAYNMAGKPLKALPHFERALRIAERIYGTEHPKLEVYVRSFGSALYGAKHYQDAKLEFQRLHAICLDKYGAGTPGMVMATYNRAITHGALNESDEAERLFLKALSILEAQEKLDLGLYTWTLNSYANLLGSSGRLREALEQSERVLQLRRRQFGDESEAAAWTLNDLANIQRLLGDFEGARAHLEQSLQIQEKLKVDSTLALRSRFNLARIHRIQGNHEVARGRLQEVESGLDEIEQSLRGEFHHEFATLLVEVGELVNARQQFELALQADRGSFHDGYAIAGLATIDVREGRLDPARSRLEQALGIFETELGSRHSKTIETLGLLSTAQLALGQKETALQNALKADVAARESVATTLAYLPERQALAHAAVHRRGRDVAVSATLTSEATPVARTDVYDAALRSRAVVFDEVASRNRFYGEATDAELSNLVSRLNGARSRLANLFVLDAEDEGQLDAAHRDVERLETELARKSAEFRTFQTNSNFGIEDLSASLPIGSACLSFLRFSLYGSNNEVESYAAVLMRAGESPLFFDLGPASSIDQAVAEWQAALKAPEARYRPAGAALRNLVWDPIASSVAGISVLYVVPDGALQLVSFAALPIATESYLLEKGPSFHYLTAERDLARGDNASPNTGGLLIVGAPAFDDDPVVAEAESGTVGASLRGLPRSAFGPLPGARAEAETVEAIWRLREDSSAAGVNLLVGKSATEGAFRVQAPAKRVLHIATHGYFLEDGATSSAGTRAVGGLTQSSRPQQRETAGIGLSPLLLSGLAFAGANKRGEDGASDGILTAEEVSTLGLNGVDLAVLSACRTGAGSVRESEGVFGLRRAFLTAGVRTVVTSLWDVDDLEAQEWIETFYRQRYLSNKTIPESMRMASLYVLESRREAGRTTHPFFWGGWLAVGAVQ